MGEQRRLINLTNQRFGKLLVQERAPNRTSSKQAFWHCICDCGSKTTVVSQSLRTGHTTSCGCFHDELRKVIPFKNGLSNTPEYTVWKSMLSRCQNPTHKAYSAYGGRGIRVCARWESIEHFYSDMGPRPKGNVRYTLERLDVNGNYEPGNCTWDTYVKQGANKRKTRFVTAFGEAKIMSEWGRVLGTSNAHISYLVKNGKSLEEFAKRRGVDYGRGI